MHWVRKPRLNSAVATVAVLMVFNLLRVASLSVVMCSYSSCPSFRGARSANPESRDSPMRNCASEVWSFGPSRNDGLLRLLAKRGAEGMAGIDPDDAEFARA